MKRVVVCMTGASGSIYGYTAVAELSGCCSVDLIVSSSAKLVMKEETGITVEDIERKFPEVNVLDEMDMTAPIASGSVLRSYSGVIVIPCSTSTLASVAAGIHQNLIHRVCEVALKERVPLVLVVREAPYSTVHIKNMLAVSEAGGVILPASPGFYHKPSTISDMVNFVVGKVFDIVGIEHGLFRRWRE